MNANLEANLDSLQVARRQGGREEAGEGLGGRLEMETEGNHPHRSSSVGGFRKGKRRGAQQKQQMLIPKLGLHNILRLPGLITQENSELSRAVLNQHGQTTCLHVADNQWHCLSGW